MPRNILNEPQAKRTISMDGGELDDLFREAAGEVIRYDRASASLLQRRLSIGYARAARLIEQLEDAGVLEPGEGSNKPSTVLIKSIEDLKGIKVEEKREEPVYPETYPNYKIPKFTLVKKPKVNPWKKSLYDALKSPDFKKATPLSVPLGFGEDDKLVIKGLDEINHLIISGTATSEKEVMLDTTLVSLLLRQNPFNLKLILIDSLRFLTFYEGIPHLLTPVITEMDKTISALRWLVMEMDRRLKLFSQAQVRDFNSFDKSNKGEFPHILLVINQIEDAILFSPVETEDALARILMFAHRTGVHVVFTSNSLSSKIVPAIIQNPIPSRLLFRFTFSKDSGPNNIKEVEDLENGEAIFDSGKIQEKLNAIYTSEENVKAVVKSINSQIES